MTIVDGSHTEAQFLQHETMLWGADEVEAKLDAGYVPFLDIARNKWTWLLTQAPIAATIGRAGRTGVAPVSLVR